MREFFRTFFASILAMVVGGILLIIIFIGAIVSLTKSVTEKENKVTKGNVLMIDLGRRIHEVGETNSIAAFSNGASYQAGLYDIVKSISHAKNDASIQGIFIKTGTSPNGWGTLQQLRLSLEDFKLSKKFIYAYGESIPQNAYFVASVADSIFLNPVGNIELKGFATIMAYFKGTLEKLDLQPEIFYAGKFKSATEPFRADRMSDPNREQIIAFQKGFWDQFTTAASLYMKCDKAVVNRLAVTGAIEFPEDALKNKMVAGLLYWDEVEKRIKSKINEKDNEDIKFMSIDDYAFITKSEGKYSDKRIAILVAEGEISDGEQNDEHSIASKTLTEQIRKVRNDDKIKAVVLRVNSPGGSALASEIILRELILLKEKKPIIVSMGDYAASGGYYISSLADSIFALPNTITGSIGVFGMLFNIGGMMKNKLGVTFDEVKNAPNADAPNSFRPMTAEEGKRMQNSVDTIYNIFKRHVATGRRMNIAKVDEIAQGRVWTGTDALRIGLVDGIGGMGRALKSAAAIAKLSDYKVVIYPENIDKFQMMMKKFKSNTAASEMMRTAIKEETGIETEWYDKIKSLKKMNGKCLMELPYVVNIY